MKLHSLHVSNFFTVSEANLDLSRPGVVAVTGRNLDAGGPRDSNGAGKSVLSAEALCWVLTGRTLRGASKEAVSLHGDTKVVLEGDGFTLTREQRGKALTPCVEFTQDGKTVNKVRAVEEALKESLGIDYSLVSALMIAGQDSLEFADTSVSDAERKTLLEVACGLRNYESARVSAKAEYDRLETVIEAAQCEVSRCAATATATQQALDEAREEAEIAEGLRKEALARVGGEKQVAVQAIDDKKERLEGLITKEAQASEAHAGMKLVLEESNRATREAVEVTAQARSALRVAERKVGLWKSGACPTCERPFDSPSKVSDLERGVAQLRIALDIAEREEAVLDAEAVERSVKEDIASQEVTQLSQEVTRLSVEISETEKALRSLDQRIMELSEPVEELGSRIAPLEQRLAEAQEAGARAERKIKTLESRLPLYVFWTVGFGPKGLTSYVLDRLAGSISAGASSHYAKLALQDCEIKVSAVEKLKSGEYRDRMSIRVRKAKCWQAYTDLNAGDRALVDLSLICALQDIAEQRGGLRLPVVTFDEVFAQLGPARSAAVSDFLQARAKGRGQLYFVPTNDPALRARVEEELVVTLKGGVSTVDGARVIGAAA